MLLSQLDFLLKLDELFCHNINRAELAKIQVDCKGSYNIKLNIWRNHNFESLMPFISLFSKIGGWNGEYNISSYDDSLVFNGWKSADVEVIFYDGSVLFTETRNIQAFHNRVCYLRKMSDAPIIILTWISNDIEVESFNEMIGSLSDVHFCDLQKLAKEKKIQLEDIRLRDVAGTSLSNRMQLEIAKELACHWVPASCLPLIKAIAIDLDNTLYNGILGEVGHAGVVLSEHHVALQRLLRNIQQKGIFLALISKNNFSDVLELFQERNDFPLQPNDFSCMEVSWDEKPVAMKRIADSLRIGVDSILFIDDNIGEIASMLHSYPNIPVIVAKEDASLTCQVLENFPRIRRWKLSIDDDKRIKDLRANIERERLATIFQDENEYLHSLDIRLEIYKNNSAHAERITDLSNKTNQFNLAFKRYRLSNILEYMKTPDMYIIDVAMRDKFSDSGIIAIVVINTGHDKIRVQEFCVSCRALGRKIENYLIAKAVSLVSDYNKYQNVEFEYVQGHRNQPALDWLKGLSLEQELVENGICRVKVEFLEQIIKQTSFLNVVIGE